MITFSNLSKIVPNERETWGHRTFLTFDVDWAHDEIIEDCFNLVSSYAVPSTWFVTHKFSLLHALTDDKKVEIGIHPNFNNILFGETNKTSFQIIHEILSIVPDSKSIRSHSLTQNERLIDLFHEFGLSHISNFFIPHSSKIEAIPFYLWDDMIMVPHFWQDNVSIKMDLDFPVKEDSLSGFQVFNFHPIHVFLNTNNLELYEKTRPIHSNPKELIKFRHNGVGVRSQLINLLETSKQT